MTPTNSAMKAPHPILARDWLWREGETVFPRVEWAGANLCLRHRDEIEMSRKQGSVYSPVRGAPSHGTMLRPSLRRTPEAAAVKDSAGLPWGCSVTPLATSAEGHPNIDSISAEDVPRCSECFAYINAYCMFERKNWLCSLCATRTELQPRHATSQQRAGLEEMQRGIVDLLEQCVEVDDIYSDDLKPEERPAVIAVVDMTGSEEFVEIVKSGLLSLLEALAPATLFGLVVVDRSVSVYDMRGEFPSCFTVPLGAEGEISVPLTEVLPVDCMLVQVADNKDNIIAAIESLAVVQPQRPGLAFGPCIDGLLEAFEEDVCCSLRLVAVMAHRPSIGIGTLDSPDSQKISAGDSKKSGKEGAVGGAEEYLEFASRLVAISGCIDIFIVNEDTFVGVEALSPLVDRVGGSLVFYPSIGSSTLPQDLFKTFARPFATRGLLRIRCSSGFQVARAYGHLASDETYENLYHLSCCHSDSSFAFDFEFDNPSGVVANLDVHPTMQIAFSYTCIVPLSDGENPKSFQVQRRLRIETIRTDIGRQAIELYNAADAEVTMSLLCHKIIKAIADEGIAEARMLLQDWLVILTAKYNQHMMRRTGMPMDTSFSKFDNLKMVPKFVYGMLRGKMMDVLRASRDERAFVSHICSSMNSEAVGLMLYPRLMSFPDLDSESPVDDLFVLSHAAIDQNSQQLYLLDSLTEILVFYPRAAKGSVPFPPPVDSGIRRYIQDVKDDRPLCPHVFNCAEGDASGLDFSARLWEDGHLNAPQSREWAVASDQGYDAFMETLKDEVKGYMESS